MVWAEAFSVCGSRMDPAKRVNKINEKTKTELRQTEK
jgi:hypothetical protein